ncbi:zinc transporter [Litchfieldella anticariensis FP35 = DSM 16096]|uniref:Zinc transporter n=1 Tax=Litchfieldella anticariensis (strain DSM 16096 / CECT 5854 / CIP 108499 / LMG 22089 / FP35) TaxID=1121939 RepID=S2KRQ9_LITA3|nr:metal ABC transporter ATP-binding protein [Halomonas anticariensis]EPC03188.1 zinc transporter [Halomonas anticariensis FP35 = DSM 16096]
MTLLAIEHLDIALGGHLVLEDIHLTLERGEIVTIVGPNGSGKTTLLRSIIGSLAPTRGRIDASPGLTIGYVPQRLHLDATLPMTVARFMSLPRRRPSHRVDQALDRAGVAGLGSRQMSELSGGQFQRILLARALLESPDLLILDEATQGLDQRGIAEFYRQIEQVRRELGCGVLMVSHELHVVMRASDRVVCLNRSICCEGTPERVATSPAYLAMFGHDIQDALALYRHHHAPLPVSSESLS